MKKIWEFGFFLGIFWSKSCVALIYQNVPSFGINVASSTGNEIISLVNGLLEKFKQSREENPYHAYILHSLGHSIWDDDEDACDFFARTSSGRGTNQDDMKLRMLPKYSEKCSDKIRWQKFSLAEIEKFLNLVNSTSWLTSPNSIFSFPTKDTEAIRLAFLLEPTIHLQRNKIIKTNDLSSALNEANLLKIYREMLSQLNEETGMLSFNLWKQNPQEHFSINSRKSSFFWAAFASIHSSIRHLLKAEEILKGELLFRNFVSNFDILIGNISTDNSNQKTLLTNCMIIYAFNRLESKELTAFPEIVSISQWLVEKLGIELRKGEFSNAADILSSLKPIQKYSSLSYSISESIEANFIKVTLCPFVTVFEELEGEKIQMENNMMEQKYEIKQKDVNSCFQIKAPLNLELHKMAQNSPFTAKYKLFSNNDVKYSLERKLLFDNSVDGFLKPNIKLNLARLDLIQNNSSEVTKVFDSENPKLNFEYLDTNVHSYLLSYVSIENSSHGEPLILIFKSTSTLAEQSWIVSPQPSGLYSLIIPISKEDKDQKIQPGGIAPEVFNHIKSRNFLNLLSGEYEIFVSFYSKKFHTVFSRKLTSIKVQDETNCIQRLSLDKHVPICVPQDMSYHFPKPILHHTFQLPHQESQLAGMAAIVLLIPVYGLVKKWRSLDLNFDLFPRMCDVSLYEYILHWSFVMSILWMAVLLVWFWLYWNIFQLAQVAGVSLIFVSIIFRYALKSIRNRRTRMKDTNGILILIDQCSSAIKGFDNQDELQ